MKHLVLSPGLLAILVLGCGDRPDVYDAPTAGTRAVGLESQVALVDDGGHRVTLLTPQPGQELMRTSLAVGKGIVKTAVSADGKRLFVLSAGDIVRKKDQDERASLTVIEGGAARRYPLEGPHSALAIDPEGRFLALFADGSAQSAFVENPNEIVIVDLQATDPAQAVTPRSIRSFGARPQRVTFSPKLGGRRLVVVETEQDLALLDLDHIRDTPRRPEITVRLTSGGSTATNQPAGVVFDASDTPRIGVRLASSPNVVTVTIAPGDPDAKPEDPSTVPNDFRTTLNLTDVGGVPTDLAFVRTDVGQRLAAVVPSAKRAVLVDPTTSITTNVDLNEPFSRLSLITSVVGGANDTALLYGAGQGVAFWSLGKANGQPYRSVEVVALASAIDSAIDVPPPRPELKVLSAKSASAFYVLNLASRTASPLTTIGSADLHLSRDGQRVWAYRRGTSSLASVALGDLHPLPVPLDRPIDGVFDVARADGGRSLVAIDARGSFGATVLDALSPDPAQSHSYYGLLLEGLR